MEPAVREDNSKDPGSGEKQQKETPTVNHMLNEFATSTTAHGISRIASASEIRFKIIWFIVWLGVISFFIYMTTTLVLLYRSKPVSTSIKIKIEQPMPFPAVTVCNLNMVQKSLLQDLSSGSRNILKPPPSNSQADGPNEINTGEEADHSVLTVDSVEADRLGLMRTINSLSEDVRYEKGYKFKDFIKYCSIGGVTCHNGYMKNVYWRKFWNWKYGTCFSFNSKSIDNGTNIRVLNSSSSGMSDGLTLYLDIIREDYIPEVSGEEGVRVQVSDQDMVFLPVENGFSVSPGVVAGVALKKAVLQREDTYNNGSCRGGYYFGSKYTMKNCFSICKGLKQLEVCNCTEINYMLLLNSRPCNTQACVLTVNHQFSLGTLDCSSRCPPECKEVEYRKTVTQGKIYAPSFLKSFANLTSVGHNKSRPTENYVTKNIVQLKIFFADSSVEEIVTESYYKLDNLVSDIGGQLGLWIGVSVVTVIEFLALTWNLIHYCLNRPKSGKVNQESNVNT